jgi:hypothetical protein
MDFIVPHHDFTMGQFLTAFLWAFMMPTGAAIGIAWGMEAAARKQNDESCARRYCTRTR